MIENDLAVANARIVQLTDELELERVLSDEYRIELAQAATALERATRLASQAAATIERLTNA